jgi:hypothetical protein
MNPFQKGDISQANVAKSFGIGPHKFLRIDENYFNGRGLIFHDLQ